MSDESKKGMGDGDEGVHVRKIDDVCDGSGRVMGAVVHVHRPSACPYQGASSEASSGPAKVSTDAYRSGYERIFGGRTERGIA